MPVKVVVADSPIRYLIDVSPQEGYATTVFEDMFTDVLEYFPETTGKNMVDDDVLLFDGGTDVDPALYDEKPSPFTETPNKARDAHERAAFIRAQATGAACIGICRGAQLLTVLSGGKLIQHITNHNQPHHILTSKAEQITANSVHHQMMWPYETDYKLLAWAPGPSESFCEYGKLFLPKVQPEVVWYPQTRSLCIQGHPEYLTEKARFYQYCRELVKELIFKEKSSAE